MLRWEGTRSERGRKPLIKAPVAYWQQMRGAERGLSGKADRREGTSASDRARPRPLCARVLAEPLPAGCKALDKSINLYELYEAMAYKTRVIPLMTVLHGHYESPVKKITGHIKTVPTEAILRKQNDAAVLTAK